MTAQDQAVIDRLTPEEIVALTVWGEARGASPELRAGIAAVVQNRVSAQLERWGLTPQDVCLTRGQFSCWSASGGGGNAANHAAVIEAAGLVAGKSTQPGPILRECLALAWHVTGADLEDTTKGGVMYYDPAAMVPRGRVPPWAIGKQPTAIIDRTIFFGMDAA